MKYILRLLQFTLLCLAIASFSPALGASELEKQMKNIENNTRTLKKFVGDPAKKADSLAAIDRIIKSAEASKTLTPKKAEGLPEADRTKFMADYAKQLDGLIEQFKKIATDLTADKTEDAKADFEKIREIKREGHKQFAAKD